MSVFPERLVRSNTFRPLVISLTLAIVLSALMPIIGVVAALVIATGSVLVLIDVTLAATQTRLSGGSSKHRAHPEPLSTRSVLNALAEHAVIGTDLTGLIDVWNSGAAIMFGLEASEVEGSRYVTEFLLLHERHQEVSDPPKTPTPLVRLSGFTPHPRLGTLVESVRLGRAENRPWSYRAKGGPAVSVSLEVCPRIDESGTLVGYTFLARDLTSELEIARVKDDFVGMVAHELRTPLSSILGYIDLVRDDDSSLLSHVQHEYLAIAERNGHRLLGLVGDLQFTGQVGAGTFPLQIATTLLGDVISAAVLSAGPSAGLAGVDLVIVQPAEPISVPADAGRLGQAIDNLISNAIKFTPQGGRVTVELSRTACDIAVSISDTGIGIPPAEIDRLGGRFFRASTALRSGVAGVGFGLMITKAIVDAHEGEIAVTSEEGVGSRFTMTLPLQRRAIGAAA